MKNRNLLILGLGILLSSCTGNNTSSTPMTLEKALLELGDNFHTVYQDKNGSYDYYQQDNFSYDTYNNLGLLTMKNGGCYEFTIADNNVICSLPSINDNKYYDNYISKIDLSIDDFEEVDGAYISTDESVCDQVASLANYYDISKVEVELENSKLKFYLYNADDSLAVSGKVMEYKAEYEPITSFLNTYESPSKINNENAELVNRFSGLNNNYTFEIGSNVSVKMNQNGYFNTSSNQGYIILEDGVHACTLSNNTFGVYYDVAYTLEEYYNLFNLDKIYFNKFIKVNDTEYLTYDDYNIYSLSNFFGADYSKVSHIKIKLTEEKIHISFNLKNQVLLEGDLYDINNTNISYLDNYINNGYKPSLKTYDNTELVNLTSSLDKNFTFQKEDEYVTGEEKKYYPIYSTEKGRLLQKEEIFDVKTNYFISNGVAYNYVIKNDNLNLSIENTLSMDEYNKLYSFKSIDFNTFEPLGNNKYQTTAAYNLRILNYILDGSVYDKYQDKAIVEIKDNKLYFELTGNMASSKGYIENIGTTTIDKFNNDIIVPTWINSNNSTLNQYLNNLKNNNNFTVFFTSNSDTSDIYTEQDYDYWTNEAVYFGLHKQGIVYSENGYLYEYGDKYDEDTEEEYFTIGTHPLTYKSISEFNPLSSLTEEWINRIEKIDETNYQTSYSYIISAFLKLADINASIEKIEFVLENNELSMTFIDDENDTYGPVIIKNVGETKIPNFANTPKIY